MFRNQNNEPDLVNGVADRDPSLWRRVSETDDDPFIAGAKRFLI